MNSNSKFIFYHKHFVHLKMAANYLSMNEKEIINFLKEEKLPLYKIAEQIFICLQDIDNALEKYRVFK